MLPRADAPPARILLVDDQPENLLALEAILAPLGQDLVRAASGEEALKHLLRDDFALILLDVRMPCVDGFETARHIKQLEKTRRIPIIFLTGNDRESQHVVRGYSAGAVDFIFKPFDPEILRSKAGVFIDLFNLRREAEELSHRALHDPLTKLPNRTLCGDRLELALHRMRRGTGGVAVLFFDLDRFKEVNDSYGHAVGDGLLVEVAKRVRARLRPADTFARLGGDEFVVVCEGLDEQAAVEVARRVEDAVETPLPIGGHTIALRASIGIALAGVPDTAPAELLAQADQAMYRVKAARATGQAHAGISVRTAVDRLQLETALRRALEENAFRVWYQPQVSLESGDVVSVEALVRWECGDRGLVGPRDWLEVAEETGLIVPIGEAVLDEASRQVAAWRSAGRLPHLSLSVNVSRRQLVRADFAERVERALQATATEPSRLCVEITEEATMDASPAAIGTLRDLAALGVRIAVDNFGAAHFSLRPLRDLPLDVLKIDASLVDGTRDTKSRETARAVIDLASAFGLSAVAGCVETAEQAVELQALGFGLAQGFCFSPPLDADRMNTLLEHPLGPHTATFTPRARTHRPRSRPVRQIAAEELRQPRSPHVPRPE